MSDSSITSTPWKLGLSLSTKTQQPPIINTISDLTTIWSWSDCEKKMSSDNQPTKVQILTIKWRPLTRSHISLAESWGDARMIITWQQLPDCGEAVIYRDRPQCPLLISGCGFPVLKFWTLLGFLISLAGSNSKFHTSSSGMSKVITHQESQT